MKTTLPGVRSAGTITRSAVAKTAVGLACILLIGCLKLSPTSLQFGLSPSTLTFHAAPRGTNPAAQDVTVTNAGVVGSLTGLAASVSYDSKASGWLAVALSSTSVPSTMSVQPATGSLAAATYTATISVSANGALNGPQTVSVTFVVGSGAGNTAPAAPTLSAVTPGESQVTVTWAASTGATSYNIYYAQGTTVATGTGTKVAGVSSPYTIGALTDGKKYAFLVTAVGSAGETAGSNVLSTPVGVSPRIRFTSYDSTHVWIDDWMPVLGASSYNAYYAAGSTVTPATGTQVTSYLNTNPVATLSTGTQYAFVLTAVYAGGEGPASAVVTATPSATPAIGDFGLTTVKEVVGTPIPATAAFELPIANLGGGTLSGLSASVTYSGAATGWLALDSAALSALSLPTSQQGNVPFTLTLPSNLAGPTTAQITYSSSQGGVAPLVLDLTFTPDGSSSVDGQFTISPAVSAGGTYDFGSVNAGPEADGVVFALTNNTGGTITTGSPFVTSVLGAFGPLALTPDSTPVSNGSTAYFGMSFTPFALGLAGPTLITVSWTGATGSPLTFNVQGTGQ